MGRGDANPQNESPGLFSLRHRAPVVSIPTHDDETISQALRDVAADVLGLLVGKIEKTDGSITTFEIAPEYQNLSKRVFLDDVLLSEELLDHDVVAFERSRGNSGVDLIAFADVLPVPEKVWQIIDKQFEIDGSSFVSRKFVAMYFAEDGSIGVRDATDDEIRSHSFELMDKGIVVRQIITQGIEELSMFSPELALTLEKFKQRRRLRPTGPDLLDSIDNSLFTLVLSENDPAYAKKIEHRDSAVEDYYAAYEDQSSPAWILRDQMEQITS